MKFAASIPVIDMNDFRSNKHKHNHFIATLKNAMQTVGFIAVVNTKVEPNILDKAYNEAANFYAQDTLVKMQAHGENLNGQRGYVQSEQAQGHAKKDHKEFYHIARDYSQQIREEHGYPDNIWPKNNTVFKSAMQNLIYELDQYIPIIEAALAESLGLPVDFFNNMTAQGNCLLRSIHYPANPPEDCLWAAEHTDIDLFTILPRATEQGLQVQTQDGKWVDVIVPNGAFIINAGDLLENLTNGIYRSAKHRVISSNENVERYSMVFFVHPRPNDKMDPLPQFIQQVGERKFPKATAQELLFARLIELGLHSEELLEAFRKSGTIRRMQEVGRASSRLVTTVDYGSKLKAKL